MKTRLQLEPLERRDVPALFGTPWADPGHLTFSFVPDGTTVDGRPSQLFDLMRRSGLSVATWEGDVVAALDRWAAAANIDVAVVADHGEALGTQGKMQGDRRFGDIRIAACSLGTDVVAVTAPPDPEAGTRAGDIVFNSTYLFTQGAGPDDGTAAYDLQTVATHEVGHALGLPDGTDPASVMYDRYEGAHVALSAGDVTAIQALYGVKTAGSDVPQILENADKNGTFAKACALSSPNGYAAGTHFAVATTFAAGDLDYYRVQVAPSSRGDGVTITVAASRAVAPRVDVFDANGNALASVVLADSWGRLVVRVGGAAAGETVFVRVSGSVAAAYELTIDAGTTTDVPQVAAAGTLGLLLPANVQTLSVAETSLTALTLKATGPAGSSMRMTLIGLNGLAITTLTARAGETATGAAWLDAGTYVVIFETITTGGLLSLGTISYILKTRELTDPQGVAYSDPTYDPSGSSSSPPPDGSQPPPPSSPPPSDPPSPWWSVYYAPDDPNAPPSS